MQRFSRVLLALVFFSAASSDAARVDLVSLSVGNLEKAVDFYKRVLGFHPIRVTAVEARLRLGDEVIELHASPNGKPYPPTRSNDLWFQHLAIIVSDMDKAFAKLKENHVTLLSEEGPQRIPDWNKGAGGIRACYFADPDGHPLEMLWFPPGKGQMKWQRKDALFLGIDHTAISISSTEKSLEFYEGKLGFKRQGFGENYGPEQERLNHVPGAHLRITSVRGTGGPAIEFLEYLKPGPGRSYPKEATSGDLVYTQTVVSDEPTACGAPRDCSLRDPDGHAIEVRL